MIQKKKLERRKKKAAVEESISQPTHNVTGPAPFHPVIASHSSADQATIAQANNSQLKKLPQQQQQQQQQQKASAFNPSQRAQSAGETKPLTPHPVVVDMRMRNGRSVTPSGKTNATTTGAGEGENHAKYANTVSYQNEEISNAMSTKAINMPQSEF